jgi:hypothetical protein
MELLMRKTGLDKVCLAAGDVQVTEAMVALVSDAVVHAMQTTVEGAAGGVVGQAAGERLRDVVGLYLEAIVPDGAALTSEERSEQRAMAFRRMAGVGV